jgi:hypothetical protein
MSRDPRINPEPGDRLKVRGKVVEVVEGERARPAIIHCLVNGEYWTMGIYWWQQRAAGAEIVEC